MKLFLVMVSSIFFACQRNTKSTFLITDDLKYSAYTWHLSTETPTFYLAYYIDINNDGHYLLMRHDTFMDVPKYFKGEISGSIAETINNVFEMDSYATDYSIRPEDNFIYDGFTYCFDYHKTDSLQRKIQFIPNKSPNQIKQLSALLDQLIYSPNNKSIDSFDLDQYSNELSIFSLQSLKQLPKPEKPNIIIKEK